MKVSGKLIRRVLAGVGVTTMAGGMLLAGAPAQAGVRPNVPLSISASCRNLGSATVLCTASASFGAAPYTYTWSINGVVSSGATTVGACVPLALNFFEAIVTDSAGNQASLSNFFSCH